MTTITRPSWYSDGDKGFATLIIQGEQGSCTINIEGDKLMVENMVKVIEATGEVIEM